jgi:hypothetical protein
VETIFEILGADMSRYLEEDRPPEPRHICYAPEEWADLAEWEESRGDHYKARVKELEAELCKLKKCYDVVSAYAAHYTPDHKLEDKRKELNEAYE